MLIAEDIAPLTQPDVTALFADHGDSVHGFCLRVLTDPDAAATATALAFAAVAREAGPDDDRRRQRIELLRAARHACGRVGARTTAIDR